MDKLPKQSQMPESNFANANKSLRKLPTKKKTEQDKKMLLSFLSGEYGITYFNKAFGFKLEHIHNGTLQNLQTPITYDVLLDMFKHYKNKLDETRVYKKSHGKGITDPQLRLNYDLAIVLNKHSEYVQDMEQAAAKENELKEIKQESITKLVSNPVKNENNSDGIDISKTLEEW